MSIFKQFAGQSIGKPGAYSLSQVSNANGAQLSPDNILFIIGESTAGAPGSVNGIQSFASTQMNSLVATFGSGPLIDAAIASVRVSKDPTVGGAGTILVYKTNASTQASGVINEATNSSPLLNLLDPAWGSGGNNKSITIAAGDSGLQKNVTIGILGASSLVLGENPATAVLSIQYTGNGSTATATISGASMAAKALTTSLTGQSDSSVNLNITLVNYTLSQLVAYINMQPGYSAVLLDPTKAAMQANILDPIAATGIKSAALSLYRLQGEIVDLINGSGLAGISASLATTPVIGLPHNTTNLFLSGGAQGASANSSFGNGLAASLAQTYDQVVPCVSQDATADIAMLATDPGSTYTIAAVQAALTAHLALRGSIKNRKEAQGITGFRSSTKSAAFTQAAQIGDQYVQMVMQDVLISDVNANLTWKQPHVLAAMCAGYRLGVPVGTPLTHKYLNINGFGQYVNPTTGIAGGDFNPDLDYDAAIMAGATFLETASGGSRIVVDNTTYGIDASFVFNRGSVMEASIYAAQNVRAVAETYFVGTILPNGKVSGGKISGGGATSLKNVITQELEALWTAQVLSTSIDAPKGYVESTFVVTVTGNTAYVYVEIKPVQGLDFIFITFTLGDTQTSA
jgi:hypothetical protein